MGEVSCLYCGQRIPDDLDRCPGCGAPSHYQEKGWRLGARRRFILFVVVLTVVTLLLAVWLPR